jgi:hypothetical protein
MSGLSKTALLVELNISAWSGRKLDRKVTSEVNTAKVANKDASRVNKNLFAGSDRLAEINNYASTARQEYYAMTLPWSTSGTRLLPFVQIFDFKTWAGQKEQEYETMVDKFLQEYSTLISAQAFRLGTMFDAKEYPPATELANKFKFSTVLMPMPEAGDFRIDAEADLAAELKAQYEQAYTERTNAAMQDIWDRLFETVSHLRDKCALEKTIFRESTMDNAMELCQLLTRLNVTGDVQLEERRKELEKALAGTSTEILRADPDNRKSTKEKLDAMLAKMKGF